MYPPSTQPQTSRIFLAFLFIIALQAPSSFSAQPASDPEQRLQELGLALPAPARPVANFVTAVRTGNLLFVAGHGPCGAPSEKVVGKVGRERTIEEGYEAARQTALCLLATVKAELGSLDKVQRIVRVFGMVNAVEGFEQHPKVINGCSDLLVSLFGERGKHARAAVGMASLPFNWTVEIEMVVEVAE
ncbi:MAG: RidA family protein [Deltaproteobacteria bacterium]|nr:RidA family protein [Deltaproteobacteria bacterium]